MKKLIIGSLCCVSLLSANNTLTFSKGNKDYKNSFTKVDGDVIDVRYTHNYDLGDLSFGLQKDTVDREHSITNAALPTLRVKKYNALYNHHITNALDLKVSYIKIIDNLAPTDQGKIYGLGGAYKLPKGFGVELDLYRSDYEQFNVDQYNFTLFKKFKIDQLKGKFSIIGKSIHIDGDKYANYTFKDKEYFTAGVKLGLNYQSYFGGVGAFFGKRMFTVLDDGQKVQHHAMEQDKTYMLSLGKKFEAFDIIAKYSFQNGKELPENRDDVDQEVVSLGLNIKF